ncbi:hypothetical protein DXA11_04480 [Bacteroides sp. AM56-10ce]|nr:hypothetical protein DXA11_04480 [Bacteroides sp. AM56-10ce]
MYKSCKNILIALLFGNYLSIKKDRMNIIFFYVIRKLFKHKKRPDEHYFFLYSHSLITFMQKIDYQGFFYIK